MSLLDRPCWIFDLDGTLTVAQHDFEALRETLGLPTGLGILEAILELPAEARERVVEALARWEDEHADRAQVPPDVPPLLKELQRRGVRMGVLTRNTRRTALRTLEVTGLDRFFVPRWILGRSDAAAKPSPEGVELLLREWAVDPADAVMVGDFRYDILAGQAAGVATVLIDRLDRLSDWDTPDIRVGALTELLG